MSGQCYVEDRLLPMQHAHCPPSPLPPLPSQRRLWIQRNSMAITVWHQRRRSLLLKPFPEKGNCKATVIIARWPPLVLQNRRPLQYNTIQYNTIQYNTIQYNTIQYNTIQYNFIHPFRAIIHGKLINNKHDYVMRK